MLFSSRPKKLVFCSLYKVKEEGSCLRYGTAKKPKATKDQLLWPGAKKHPTIKGSFLLLWEHFCLRTKCCTCNLLVLLRSHIERISLLLRPYKHEVGRKILSMWDRNKAKRLQVQHLVRRQKCCHNNIFL